MTDRTPPPAQEALPALPEPQLLRVLYSDRPAEPPYTVYGYTAEQMHAYLLADRAARAAPAAVWQPIETAPKDGTWILVAGPDRTGARRMVVRWDGIDWESADDEYHAYIKPTHWMPLSAAPKASHD